MPPPWRALQLRPCCMPCCVAIARQPRPFLPTAYPCRSGEEEEEVRVNHSALLPQALAAPQRKKRWWKWEDRELVTAWLG